MTMVILLNMWIIVIIRSTLMQMPPTADSTSARLFQELDMEVAKNTMSTSQGDWKGQDSGVSLTPPRLSL